MSTMEVARNGYQLLRPQGILDGHTEVSKDFTTIVERACANPKAHYILDLKGVEYINSSMLGLMVRLLYSVQDKGFKLILLSPPPGVENVLIMTGLSELMPLASREEEACELLGVPQPRPSASASEIDYDQLTAEIEGIITEGDADKARKNRKKGELRKLLGE